jgi:hypothetical protein
VSQPKYNDGKYHSEFGYHEGRKEGAWFVVNVYGELCYDEIGTVCFVTRTLADQCCDQLNEVPEGGLVTNLV